MTSQGLVEAQLILIVFFDQLGEMVINNFDNSSSRWNTNCRLASRNPKPMAQITSCLTIFTLYSFFDLSGCVCQWVILWIESLRPQSFFIFISVFLLVSVFIGLFLLLFLLLFCIFIFLALRLFVQLLNALLNVIYDFFKLISFHKLWNPVNL